MSGNSVLRVEELTKVFGAGRTMVRAVDGVGFDASAGEVVLIMGPSGSGKTTLLTMIGGLLRPTSGRIFIEDVEITALRQAELPRVRRHHVGFVFQTFNLLDTLSAQENVEVALNVAGVRGARGAGAGARAAGRGGAGGAARLQGEGPVGRREAAGVVSRGRWRTSRGCCWRTSRRRTSTAVTGTR